MLHRWKLRSLGYTVALALWCTVSAGCGGDRGPVVVQGAAAPKLAIGKQSLVGNIRQFNDDFVAVEDLNGPVVCLVADGMGGEAGGKPLGLVAAERAFEVLIRELRKELPRVSTQDETRVAIRRSIVTANKDLIEKAAQNSELRNAGTTVALAVWRPGDGMYVAGVGDSRAYLIRGETISQLTIDHTLARALVESKTITAEEARTHRFRNVLWKYLGSTEVGDGPEIEFMPFEPSDRLLLCTDGIHGVVPDERILRCSRQCPLVQQCADSLCQLSLEAGSRDNVSCVVIEVER